MLRDTRGQWAIIEIVVVVAILVVLAYIFVPRYIGGTPGEDSGEAGTPIGRAKSVDCMNNLRNIRVAVSMYRQTNEDRLPASIADLESSGISGSVTRCPISGAAYSYDPATGQVRCATPGHERY